MSVIQAIIASSSGGGAAPPPPPPPVASEFYGTQYLYDSLNGPNSVFPGAYGLTNSGVTSNTGYTYADGTVGRAWVFNGTSSSWMSPNLNDTSALTGKQSLSFEMWIYPTANGVTLLTELGQNAYNTGWNATVLEINSSNQVMFRLYSTASLTSADPVTLNAWNHIYASYNHPTTTLSLRINNGNTVTLVDSSRSSNYNGGGAVYFGIGGANPGQSLGNNGFFAGYLGMVRLQFWAAQSSYWTNAKRFLNAASTPISDANTQLLLDGLTAPSGATWPDTSPQNRTINLVGTTVRDAGVGYYRFGTGTSTNAYCNADSTNFGTINTTPAQTMSMWIRPTSNNSSYQAIAGIRPEGSYNFYLLILTNDTTEYRVTTNTVNPHDVVVSFGQFYTRWTHVTCVADGTQSRLYFNGLLAGTTTLDGTFGSNTTNFKIADPAWSTAQLDVATLQFYNRVLTVDEIARNYAVDKHRLGL